MTNIDTTGQRRIIVFDVNETLLDIEALTPVFERIFGDGAVMREWFAQTILYSQALTLSQRYVSFGELGQATLHMVAACKGLSVDEDGVALLRKTMQALPPHADVRPALTRLREAGFRLVTLTNSAPEAAAKQMAAAGLGDLFERQFSVESVSRYKPARHTYLYVAEHLGVEPSALRLVAAHTWDVIGALAAGCAAALVTRPGNAPLGTGPQPDIVAPDMGALAEAVIARDAVG